MTDHLERIQAAFDRTFKQRLSFDADLQQQQSKIWDSLHHVQFMVELEREFDIRFDGAEVMALNTIALVADAVRARTS